MPKPKIVRYTSKELEAMLARGESRTDWERVRNMTEAEVERNARADPDAPPLTDKELSQMKGVRRGRPKLARPKQQVTLRLSAKVLAHYRAGGPGWQTRIDADLRKLTARR